MQDLFISVVCCLTEPSSGSQQVDLFGQDLIGDFLDDPVSVPTDKSNSLDNDPSNVDLFADAAFVSATPQPAAEKNPQVKLSYHFSKRQCAFVILQGSLVTVLQGLHYLLHFSNLENA